MSQPVNEPANNRETDANSGYGTWPGRPSSGGFRGIGGRGFRGIAWWHSIWVIGLFGALARFNNAVLDGPPWVTAVLIGAAIALAVRMIVRVIFTKLATKYVWAIAAVAFVAAVIAASSLWRS